MIAVWMLYCVGIGLAFVVVGFALERGLHLAGRPTRWAWVIALAGSYLVPAAAWARPDAFSTFAAPIPMVVELSPSTAAVTSTTSAIPHQPPTRSFSLSDLDWPLRWGWGLASVAILATLAGAATRLVSLRRRWRQATVDGRSILVSQDVGPAVVGLWSPRIVLPEWALDLPESDRELMLAHEEQHLRAADPAVIALGFALVLLAPWNVALWWQWRRLRLATEMDCDARVLADGRYAPAYGELLLHVGQRRSRQPLGAAAFGEPVSFLETRIRRMLSTMPRWRWAGVTAAVVVAAGAIAGACETPRPLGPGERLESLGSPVGVTGIVSEVIAPPDIDQAPVVLSDATTYYPDLPRLAGVAGRVVIQAKVDANGRADPASVSAVQSPHPALAEAAKQAVRRARFRPAQSQGRSIDAVVLVIYDFVIPTASIRDRTRAAMDRLALQEAHRLRPWVKENLQRYSPELLNARSGGPPVDVFLVHDSRRRVMWQTAITPGGAAIGIAELRSAFKDFNPGHDAWGVIDPRGLRGLVRDNVRVIWIHHDPLPRDTATDRRLQTVRRALADRVLRLARQYHPEAFVRPQSNAAVALVMDLEDRVLAHATGIRIPSDESCMDVLTRLLPEFRNAQWLVSGCADGDAQHKLTVYWGTLLKR